MITRTSIALMEEVVDDDDICAGRSDGRQAQATATRMKIPRTLAQSMAKGAVNPSSLKPGHKGHLYSTSPREKRGPNPTR